MKSYYLIVVTLDAQYQNISKEKCTIKASKRSSPPQQNPATPMADAPLVLKAAITGLASSYPLSYKYINFIKLNVVQQKAM